MIKSSFGFKIQGVIRIQLEVTNGYVVMTVSVGTDPVMRVFAFSVKQSFGEFTFEEDVFPTNDVKGLCR